MVGMCTARPRLPRRHGRTGSVLGIKLGLVYFWKIKEKVGSFGKFVQPQMTLTNGSSAMLQYLGSPQYLRKLLMQYCCFLVLGAVIIHIGPNQSI